MVSVREASVRDWGFSRLPLLFPVSYTHLRYPVWYANGNHEQRITKHPEEYGDMGEAYDREIEKTGAVRLINEKAKVEVRGIPVTIYGFEPEESYYGKGMRKKGIRKDLEEQFGVPERDCYTILLSHHPRYGKEYLEWGADLTPVSYTHLDVYKRQCLLCT